MDHYERFEPNVCQKFAAGQQSDKHHSGAKISLCQKPREDDRAREPASKLEARRNRGTSEPPRMVSQQSQSSYTTAVRH
jgi:hypothetical protein